MAINKVLSIDIGGTNFRIGIVRNNRKCDKFDKVPTQKILHSGDVLGDLAAFLKEFS